MSVVRCAIGFRVAGKPSRARDPCRKENPRRLAPQTPVNGSENCIKHQSPSPGPSKGQSQAPVLCEIRFDIKATAKQKCRRAFDVQILLWPKAALLDCNNIELKWITFFPSLGYSSCVNSDNEAWWGVKVTSRGVKAMSKGLWMDFLFNLFFDSIFSRKIQVFLLEHYFTKILVTSPTQKPHIFCLNFFTQLLITSHWKLNLSIIAIWTRWV